MLNIFINVDIFQFGGFILLALLGILFLIKSVLAESWVPVVFLVMGMFTLLAFVGAMASSVLLKVTRKENKK